MSGLDVFVGANGVGKTNLYRALELLQSAAGNTLAEDLAREGGLKLALWAGQRRRTEQPELRLEVGLADPDHHPAGSVFKYEVVVGFPTATTGASCSSRRSRRRRFPTSADRVPIPWWSAAITR
jgi:predicted ATPase